MSNYIYFATIDNSIIDNYKLAAIAKITDGISIPEEDFDAIREYASTCKGIKKELDNTSIKFLLENGKRVQAIQLYYRSHPEIRLTEAR